MTYGTIGNETLTPTTTSVPTSPTTMPPPTAPTTTPTTAPRPAPSTTSTTTTTAPAEPGLETQGFSTDPALRARLAHLFRRAGFGASAARLDIAEQAGYDATVETLLTPGDPAADAIAPPPLTMPPGPIPSGTDERTPLIVWWLQRMAAADTNPLSEKLPWFWHGHLTSALSDVGWPSLMLLQNQLFRTYGWGDFPTLIRQITTDPAMLIYLDLLNSKRTAPNENYARELCELFVLGRTDHTGTQPYTEADVQAAAKALTGWVTDSTRTAILFDPTRWDSTTKTFLGQTGAWGTDDIVRIVTRHPAAARRIPARLWSFFAYPVGSTDPVVAELATTFATELDITKLLRRIFLHPQFQSAAARQGRVKTPVEWVLGALRAIGVTPDASTYGVLRTLLQYPFEPPNVAGWPANGYWVNTVSALDRVRVAQSISRLVTVPAIANAAPADRPAAAAAVLGVEAWSARTASALAAAQAEPQSVLALALVSPEYVLN
ncbi:MAG: DUF1800 domain-containing protein [Actinobacteria bacterium]|nr:DUF1800 domain-containing protein [Actinomycetota bacterium]